MAFVPLPNQNQKRPPIFRIPGRSKFQVEKKFRSALLASNVQIIKDEIRAVYDKKKDLSEASLDANLIIHRGHETTDDLKVDTTFLPRVLLEALEGSVNRPVNENNKETLQTLKKVLELQVGWWTNSIKNPDDRAQLNQGIMEKFSENWPREILNLIAIEEELTRVMSHMEYVHEHEVEREWTRELVEKKASKSDWKLKTIPSVTLQWGHRYTLITIGDDTWILPRVTIQEMHAKVSEMLSMLLYVFWSRDSGYPPNIYFVVRMFMVHYCQCHVTCPKYFFTFAKTLEGLCLGRHLSLTEEKWDNTHLWDNIITDLKDTLGPDYFFFTGVINYLAGLTAIELAAVGCMAKITGHPLIDVSTSIKRVHERATEEIEFDVKAVGDLVNIIKSQVVRHYVGKKKRWPEVKFEDGVSLRLIEAKRMNDDPYSDSYNHHGDLKDEHWSMVTFMHSEEYEEFESLIPHLDDKTITLTLPRVRELFFTGATQTKQDRIDSRLLLAFLTSGNTTDAYKEYIKLYNKACDQGDYDIIADYMVMRLVAKELELKGDSARFYGIKTFLDRFRGMEEESNAMRFLRDYSPSQALQLTELQLQRKIHALTHLRDVFKDHTTFMVSMDASAWCSRFRSNIVSTVCEHTLCQLFDTDRFKYVQHAYENTLYYVPDYPLPHAWQGQLGGIEGLNQTLWTMVYMGEVSYAYRDLPGEQKSMIKGDDTRIFLIIPDSEVAKSGMNYNDYGKMLMQRISDAAAKFGQHLKVPESYISEFTFAFGKIIHFKCMTMPCDIRKIAKANGLSDALLPFFDSRMASIFAVAHSACFYSTTPVACYAVAVFWAITAIKQHVSYSKLSPMQIAAFIVTPSVVGGSSTIYIHHMMVRAESDHLTAFFDFHRYVRDKDKDVYHYMSQFLTWGFDERPNYRQLLSDPYSLPWMVPPSAPILMRTHMRKLIPRVSTNPEIHNLFAKRHSDQVDDLIKTMKTSDIWNGKVFNLLYKLSIESIADEMLTQFLTARSVVEFGLSYYPRWVDKTLNRWMDRDITLNNARRDKLNGYGRLPAWFNTDDCPYVKSQAGRGAGWKVIMGAVSQPDSPHQLIVSSPKDTATMTDHGIFHHFQVEVLEVERAQHLGIDSDFYATVPYNPHKAPFLGNRTDPGTLNPAATISFFNKLTRRIADGLMLASWTNRTNLQLQTSNCPDVIDMMLSPFVSDAVQRFHPFQRPKRSGEDEHRLNASGFKPTIMPNALVNIALGFHVESNTHSGIAGSTANLRINFLELRSHVTLLLGQFRAYLKNFPLEKIYWAETVNCPCTTECFDSPPIIFKNIFITRYLQTNQFLGLSDQAIRLLEAELAMFETNRDNIKCMTYPPGQEEAETNAHNRVVAKHLMYLIINDERTTHKMNVGIPDKNREQMEVLSSVDNSSHFERHSQVVWRALRPAVILKGIFPVFFAWILRRCTSADPDGVISKLRKLPGDKLPWATFCQSLIGCGMAPELLRTCTEEWGIQLFADALTSFKEFAKTLAIASVRYMSAVPLSDFLLLDLGSHDDRPVRYEKFHTHMKSFCWTRARTLYIDRNTHETAHPYLEDNIFQLPGQKPDISRALLAIIVELTAPLLTASEFTDEIKQTHFDEHGSQYYMVQFRNDRRRVTTWEELELLIYEDENPFPGPSGWTREEYLFIRCLMKKTIFPHKNFLREFHRTNPEEFEDILATIEPLEDTEDFLRIEIIDLQEALDTVKSSKENHYHKFNSLPPFRQEFHFPINPRNIPQFGILQGGDTPDLLQPQLAPNLVEGLQSPYNLHACLFRPFGAVDTTGCSFLALLHDLGLYSQFRDKKACGWFLNETKGGSLTTFLKISQEHVAFYNAPRSDARIPTMPIFLERDLSDRVHTSYQQVGVVDISEPHIVEILTRSSIPRPSFIHLDLQPNDEKSIAYILGAINLYKHYSTHSTTFIIKLRFDVLPHLPAIIEKVRLYCKNWMLYMPYSDYGLRTLYLIGSGSSDVTTTASNLPSHVNSVIIRISHKFIQDVIQRHRPLSREARLALQDEAVNFFRMFSRLGLPNHAVSSINQTLSLPAESHFRRWYRSLSEHVETQITRIRGWIQKKTPSIVDQEYDFIPYFTDLVNLIVCYYGFLHHNDLRSNTNLIVPDVMRFLARTLAFPGVSAPVMNDPIESGQIIYSQAWRQNGVPHIQTAVIDYEPIINYWKSHYLRNYSARLENQYNPNWVKTDTFM